MVAEYERKIIATEQFHLDQKRGSANLPPIKATPSVLDDHESDAAPGEKPSFDQLYQTLMAGRIARQNLAIRRTSPAYSVASIQERAFIEGVLDESKAIRGYTKLPDTKSKMSVRQLTTAIKDAINADEQLKQRLHAEIQVRLKAEYGDRAHFLTEAVRSGVAEIVSSYRPDSPETIQDDAYESVRRIGSSQLLEIEKDSIGDDVRKFDNFILKNVRRVESLLAPAGISLEDAAQEGRVALLEVLKNYDESKSRFLTYATIIVHGRIMDYIRNHLPVGRYTQEAARIIDHFETQFLQENGRMPTNDEIASELGISHQRIVQAKSKPQIISINHLDEGSEVRSVKELEVALIDQDSSIQPEDALLEKEEEQTIDLENRRLRAAVELLDDRIKTVITEHYFEGKPLVLVAASLEISESRVSQLSRKGLATIKRVLSSPLPLKAVLKRYGMGFSEFSSANLGKGIAFKKGRYGSKLGPIEQLTIKRRIEAHRKNKEQKKEERRIEREKIKRVIQEQGRQAKEARVRARHEARSQREKQAKIEKGERKRLRLRARTRREAQKIKERKIAKVAKLKEKETAEQNKIDKRKPQSYAPITPDDLEVVLVLHPVINDREKAILEYRAGLIDGKFKTQKEVAELVGMSGPGVCLAEKRALAKLRELEPDVFH